MLTRKQTKISLLARLTHCGRNANYCVMRIAERPEGLLLTDTSEPCSHRLSGDEAGFKGTAFWQWSHNKGHHGMCLAKAGPPGMRSTETVVIYGLGRAPAVKVQWRGAPRCTFA